MVSGPQRTCENRGWICRPVLLSRKPPAVSAAGGFFVVEAGLSEDCGGQHSYMCGTTAAVAVLRVSSVEPTVPSGSG